MTAGPYSTWHNVWPSVSVSNPSLTSLFPSSHGFFFVLVNVYEGAYFLRSLKRPVTLNHFNRCPETLFIGAHSQSLLPSPWGFVPEKGIPINLWLLSSSKEAVTWAVGKSSPIWDMLSASSWQREGQEVPTLLLPGTTVTLHLSNAGLSPIRPGSPGRGCVAATSSRQPCHDRLPSSCEL